MISSATRTEGIGLGAETKGRSMGSRKKVEGTEKGRFTERKQRKPDQWSVQDPPFLSIFLNLRSQEN